MMQTILDLLQENIQLLMIIQKQIIVQEIKLPEVLKSNLCDYKDVYVLVTGDIIRDNGHVVAFENCGPFT